MICPGYSASERLNLIPRIHFGFPSDRRLRFTPYRLDSVLYRCAVKHFRRENISVRSMQHRNIAEVELFRTSFWNCRLLHKLGAHVRTLLDLDLVVFSCWEGAHIRARASDTYWLLIHAVHCSSLDWKFLWHVLHLVLGQAAPACLSTRLGDDLPAAIFRLQSTNHPESALRCRIQRLLVCSCSAEKGPTAKRQILLLCNNKRR